MVIVTIGPSRWPLVHTPVCVCPLIVHSLPSIDKLIRFVRCGHRTKTVPSAAFPKSLVPEAIQCGRQFPEPDPREKLFKFPFLGKSLSTIRYRKRISFEKVPLINLILKSILTLRRSI